MIVIVERFFQKPYYYKFYFKNKFDIERSHKRCVILVGEGNIKGVSYSYGYYEKPFELLRGRMSQRLLDILIESSEK